MEVDMVSQKKSMLDVFDEILSKHLERLIGSRYGLGELSLNSVTISLIMLLMERENEIETFPSNEIDRYKYETLLKDLLDLGFDADHDMNGVVEEMIRKGYIHVDNDGFIPQKPAISMARLIDRVFPKMPGMNLVAYFVQTMDEVKSERKDLDSAISQFNQVLQMHGVLLKKVSQQSENTAKSHKIAPKISPEKDLKTSTILGRKSSYNYFDNSKDTSAEPKVLSSDAYKGKIEIRKVDFEKPTLIDIEPVENASDENEHIENAKLATEVNLVETPEHDDTNIESSDPKVMTPSEEQAITVVEEQSPNADEVVENTKQSIEGESVISCEKEASSISDDDIEKRVTAFGEDLALDCPLCKHSKLMLEKTATGKSYYKCSNKDCNFISWGKPHHMPCPKCNNPFLIEASNNADKTILKCPRATCRYWKNARFEIVDHHQEPIESTSRKADKLISIPRKPRKKVVRRKVVRKKR